MKKLRLKKVSRDFPGSPVVKTHPSIAGGKGSIPGWETKIPHAKKKKEKEGIQSHIAGE